MKILNICIDDYANFMYDSSMSMKAAGVDCTDMKLSAHQFKYKNQSQVVSGEQMREAIKTADVVQIYHSFVKLLEWVYIYNKPFTIWHTGSPYRKQPKEMDDIFGAAEITFTDQCEFMMMAYHQHKWRYVATAINISEYKDTARCVGERIYAHYPSSADVKGTDTIRTIFKKMNTKISINENRVSHEEQKQRMALCDIYVELHKPILHGNPYGCYGVTAFEAAAMGKAVITQNIYPTIYYENYGPLPFFIPNCERELEQTILEINNMPASELAAIQGKTREWVINNHSYEATGNYIKKIFIEKFGSC